MNIYQQFITKMNEIWVLAICIFRCTYRMKDQLECFLKVRVIRAEINY